MVRPLTKSTGREEYGRSVERSPCYVQALYLLFPAREGFLA